MKLAHTPPAVVAPAPVQHLEPAALLDQLAALPLRSTIYVQEPGWHGARVSVCSRGAALTPFLHVLLPGGTTYKMSALDDNHGTVRLFVSVAQATTGYSGVDPSDLPDHPAITYAVALAYEAQRRAFALQPKLTDAERYHVNRGPLPWYLRGDV